MNPERRPPSSQESLTPHIEESEREILAWAYFERAQHFMYLDDWHRAIDCLEEAIRYDPGSDYYRLLGRILRKTPMWRERVEEHLRQIRIAMASS
jgi:tetratricopeptide (TPR) repeat protein